MSDQPKIVVVKKADHERQQADSHIRRHAKSLRILLDEKKPQEAKQILVSEFDKYLLQNAA